MIRFLATLNAVDSQCDVKSVIKLPEQRKIIFIKITWKRKSAGNFPPEKYLLVINSNVKMSFASHVCNELLMKTCFFNINVMKMLKSSSWIWRFIWSSSWACLSWIIIHTPTTTLKSFRKFHLLVWQLLIFTCLTCWLSKKYVLIPRQIKKAVEKKGFYFCHFWESRKWCGLANKELITVRVSS